MNYAMIVATCRCVVSEIMPHPSQLAVTILTYLCGGRIFAPLINRYYGQPPCGYCLEGIEIDDEIDVHAISEDMRDRCLTVVLKQTRA
jgi:hypothetical protein